MHQMGNNMNVKSFVAGIVCVVFIGSFVLYVAFANNRLVLSSANVCSQVKQGLLSPPIVLPGFAPATSLPHQCIRPALLEENCSLLIPTGKGQLRYHDIYHALYKPRGYEVCSENRKGYWLELRKQFDCGTLFEEFLNVSATPMLPVAPKEIPTHLYNNFTLNGLMTVSYAYYPYTLFHSNKTTVWSTPYINDFMNRARNKAEFSYPGDTGGLYSAMEKHAAKFKGGSVLVLGSMTPWVEAIALINGAGKVLTAEYARLSSDDPRISVEHPVMLARNWRMYAGVFDAGISFSSLEHPGLGRYTDPICPDCDMLELQKAACLVKPGGLFFLALPQGRDRILFNAHRYFGLVRLPLLTANWKLIDYFRSGWGMEEIRSNHFRDVFIEDAGSQGVMVLENTRCQPCG